METTNNQFKIGFFIVFGLIIILASIFLLGANKSIFSQYIRLHAHFENVAGLTDGSVVSISGLSVGNVETIIFSKESNNLDVVLKIEKRFLYKITQGSMAEIRTQGALGDKYIYIIPGDLSGPVLNNGDKLTVAKATDIMGIFADRGKETEKVFDIINEIYKMTKTINSDNNIERILTNLQLTSSNLNLASSELKKFSSTMNDEGSQNKIKKSFAHMESILSKLDKGDGTLGALINDPSLHEQLKAFLGANPRKSHLRSILRSSIQQNDGE